MLQDCSNLAYTLLLDMASLLRLTAVHIDEYLIAAILPLDLYKKNIIETNMRYF